MDSNVEFLEVPNELVEFIKTGSKFIIAGHKEPDGDCVGSQLALRSVLLRLGKEAIIYTAGPFKRTELKNFICQLSNHESDPDYLNRWSDGAKVIIVDCSGRERTGEIQDFLEKFPCAIIDHHAAVTHPPSTDEAPVYVDATSPSCTLLIYKLINALGLILTEEEATLLLFGLCTDTGFFRHLTEKNAAVFDITAILIRCGASPKKIFSIINGGKSLSSRILLGNILSKTESHFDGRLLLSFETLDEYNIFGYESRDTDSLNQLLVSVEGVEAVVIIRQESADYCTVSLRSIDKINVSQIAASFNGGGHKNASGLTMKGDITFVKQKMLEAFSAVFTV
ncbi:MAG: bifunctional oligoribonuclease/PAP phosphatase NrnA [Treponema sp.]|nr:bifunctional oligoribonuclease/PAP phosphatase NrnA [Treponema sp.]